MFCKIGTKYINYKRHHTSTVRGAFGFGTSAQAVLASENPLSIVGLDAPLE